MGAAVQASIITGETKDVLLLDVTPLSLGIETMGGVNTKLIERNTTIPTRKSQVFSTASDAQTSVEIKVVQGERPMASDNKSLGKFILDGIPPAPRGVPQIEVTFDIDANGILNVKASDKATGKSSHITIQASSGLAKEEIERMVQEAQRNADADKARREGIEAKNEADNAAYQAEKFIKDNGDKLPEDKKANVEARIADVRAAMTSDNAEQMKAASQSLRDALSAAGEAMYAAAGAEAGAAPDKGGTPPPADDVVDGEFRESKS